MGDSANIKDVRAGVDKEIYKKLVEIAKRNGAPISDTIEAACLLATKHENARLMDRHIDLVKENRAQRRDAAKRGFMGRTDSSRKPW